MCNCKWTEVIIALVVFVTVMWPTILGAAVSKWVAAIGALVLLIHGLMCKDMTCKTTPAKASTGKKKK